MEYMTLLGAEQVERAASGMARAAEEMQRAAWAFDNAIERLRTILDEHASRVEAAVQDKQP